MQLKFTLLHGAGKQLNNSSCLCPLLSLKQVTVWRELQKHILFLLENINIIKLDSFLYCGLMIMTLYLMQLFETSDEIYQFILSLVVIFLVIFVRLCQLLLEPGVIWARNSGTMVLRWVREGNNVEEWDCLT